jgi:hypothetical protein
MRTRALLACGAAGAALYVVAGLVLAATREGFDMRRHPFSMLSLGHLGWLQVGNFVLSGLLFIAGAVGLRRALRERPGGTSAVGTTMGPLAVAGIGVGLIAGGVFRADPALGFPPGAADGPAAAISWHGNLHAAAFGLGMLSLVTAFVVFARRYAATGERAAAWYSVATAVAFVALGVTGFIVSDFRIVTVAIVLGWGWACFVATQHFSKETSA